MNSLLKRQLKKYFHDAGGIPAGWQPFIDAVDKAYTQFDDDRNMLERSLELSSGELVQANSQMRAVVDAFPDLFFRLDASGKILDHKKGSSTNTYPPARELLGRRIQDISEPVVNLLFENAIRELRERREPLSIEYSRNHQGAVDHYEARLLPLPGDEIIVIVRNISVRKKAEEELQQAHNELEEKVQARTLELRNANESLQREIAERKHAEDQLRHSMKMEAIGRLAGGIAHDFNNILTAIMGESYLISTLLGEGHPASEHAQGILDAANRAAALTQQLLAYSRRQMLQPKTFDLGELIMKLEAMLRRLIGEHIELCTMTRRNQAYIKADPGQIEQVLTNLVINARDALPAGGKITIETEVETIGGEHHIGGTPSELAPGDYVRILVSDTGTGISEETMTHLFEPFFTTKPLGKGTGLGLATCYGIVKQSGGFISAESNPGCRTEFKILLPRVEKDSPAPIADACKAPEVNGMETVLIAEDESPVRTLVAATLERLGYTVYTAADGVEALRVFDEIPFRKIDLLMADVIMPQMGGKELAEKLIARQPDVKVLFMSGYTAEMIGSHDLVSLGGEFLQKPFTPVALGEKVRECLSGKKPPAAARNPAGALRK